MSLRLIAAALALFASRAIAAPDPVALAKAFGARESITAVRLSPDGARVVFLAPAGAAKSAAIVAEVESGKLTRVAVDGGPELTLTGCGWKTDARLICFLYGFDRVGHDTIGYTRVVAVDPDGGNTLLLGQRANDRMLRMNQDGGRLIDWLPDDPDHVLMAIDLVPESGTQGPGQTADGLAVQRVNVRTNRRVTVEPARSSASYYMTDGRGTVRLMATIPSDVSGYMRDKVIYAHRPAGTRGWTTLATDTITGFDGFGPEGFDERGQKLFALRPHESRQALFAMDPLAPDKAELVFAHPAVDIGGLRRIGKYRRPVAVEYTVEGTEYHYLDPALGKLSRALSKALPGLRATVVDENWDATRKLVFAGSDTDPGRYYLYHQPTRELTPILTARQPLKDMTLGTMSAVAYPAADGTNIPAFLTLPPGGASKGLPAIVMPHGGPSSRDAWGFDWLPQYYAALGYAVLQPQYRGSAGYGEAWYKENGFKAWATAMADINDGARWLAKRGTADAARLAIVGWSYGGYAALQTNVIDPGLYRAAVAIAPVADLRMLKNDSIGFSNRAIMAKYIGDGPHLRDGSPAEHAAKIAAPVLLFHGDRDMNVDIRHARRMDSALKKAGRASELVVYPGLEHSLEDSDARADMLAKSAAFLAKHLR